MAYTLKLVKGSKTLNLSSAPYDASETFYPPTASEEPVISRGAGVNRLGGSRLIGINASNFTFDFDLHITSTTESGALDALRKLRNFLKLAGEEAEPLYLQWIPTGNVSAQPVFGQWNAARRLEIVWGTAYMSDLYGSIERVRLPDCRVSLVVKPYPLGSDHLFGMALGLVYSDVYPADAQGRSKGVKVGTALGNLVTNPSAETNTTGWSKTAELETFERSNKEALYGKWSFRMAETNSGGSNENTFTNLITGITAGQSYVASAAIKKNHCPSNQAGFISIYWYTAADAFISSDSKSFDLGEHDWKRYNLIATAPGTAAKARVRVSFPAVAGVPLELFYDGVSLINATHPRAYSDGSFRGCAWTGTAHNSSSTSTAGKLYYDFDKLISNTREVTICVQWTPDYNSSELPTGLALRLFVASGITFELYWNSTTNRWTFSDGTNSTSSATTSFSKGVPVDIRIVLESNTGKMYLNGVQSGSTGTYLPSATDGGWLYIGSTSAGASHISGTFNGLQTYNVGLTAAENLADYTNLVPLLDGRRVDWLPYVWGSSVNTDYVQWYNCNDNAARTNFVIACEVPGTVEAITRLTIETSAFSVDPSFEGGLFLSRLLVPEGYLLDRFLDFFAELQGGVEAISSGGEVETLTSLATSAQTFTGGITMNVAHLDILSGQEIAMLFRMKDFAGLPKYLQVRFYYYLGGGHYIYSNWKPLVESTEYKTRLTSFLTFKDVRKNVEKLSSYTFSGFFKLQMQRSTGGTTGNVNGDYFEIVTKPTMRIFGVVPGGYGTTIIYDSKQHAAINMDAGAFGNSSVSIEGSDAFELIPDQANYIIFAPGDIKGGAPGISIRFDDVAHITEIYATPRWGMLG